MIKLTKNRLKQITNALVCTCPEYLFFSLCFSQFQFVLMKQPLSLTIMMFTFIEFEDDDTAEDSDINGDVNEFLLAKSSEAKMFAKATFFQKFQNEKSGLTQNRPLLLRLSLPNQQGLMLSSAKQPTPPA